MNKTIVTIVLVLSICLKSSAAQNSVVPLFIFGDSLMDVGNNNYIATIARANYKPNGIDFGKPTGRFTNGRTICDIIGQEMGMTNFTPPYLAPMTTGPVILNGVNYASGAAGIFKETGILFGGRVNMDAQVDNFAKTRQDIIEMIGANATEELLNKALFQVTMGSNDFINNYLILKDLKPPVDVFLTSMISRFREQLTRLYDLNARKIVVANVGPIGCIPFVRDVNTPTINDSCVEFPNELAQSFNSQLKTLLTELNAKLVGSKFVYVDSYNIVMNITENYKIYGFENVNSSCCHTFGKHGGLIPCIPTSKVCDDRSKYMFWDPFHPSDAANIIVANRMMHGDSNDIFPMNIVQLLES